MLRILIVVVHAMRGDRIRLISARTATKHENRVYQKALFPDEAGPKCGQTTIFLAGFAANTPTATGREPTWCYSTPTWLLHFLLHFRIQPRSMRLFAHFLKSPGERNNAGVHNVREGNPFNAPKRGDRKSTRLNSSH